MPPNTHFEKCRDPTFVCHLLLRVHVLFLFLLNDLLPFYLCVRSRFCLRAFKVLFLSLLNNLLPFYLCVRSRFSSVGCQECACAVFLLFSFSVCGVSFLFVLHSVQFLLFSGAPGRFAPAAKVYGEGGLACHGSPVSNALLGDGPGGL